MAIKFKAQAKRNPQDVNLPEKYYAAAIADGEVNFEVLAEQIAYESTLTETDCYAVLLSLERNIIKSLEQGRLVKLGHLGNFKVGISSEGSETVGQVDAGLITKTRILFRPGKRLRIMLGGLTFKKAS
jgi:predicted histone-like DNA-binding protein